MRRPRLSIILLSCWAVLCLILYAGWVQSYWLARSIMYETKGSRHCSLMASSGFGVLRLGWASTQGDGPVRGLIYACRPASESPQAPPWPWRLVDLPTLNISGSGTPDPPHLQVAAALPWCIVILLTVLPVGVPWLRRRARARTTYPPVSGRFRRYAARISAVLAAVVLTLLALSFVRGGWGQWTQQWAEGAARDQVGQHFVEGLLQRGALGISIDHPRFPVGPGSVIQDNWDVFWNWRLPSNQWYWKGEEGPIFHALGFGLQHRGPTGIAGVIPLWPLAILLLILPISEFRRQRRLRHRIRHGLCLQCGYDLRSGHAKCPECGAVSTQPAPSAAMAEPQPAGWSILRLAMVISLILVVVGVGVAADARSRAAAMPTLQAIAPTTRQAAIATLIRQSRQSVAQAKYAEALAAVDQILALDPANDYAKRVRPAILDRAKQQGASQPEQR